MIATPPFPGLANPRLTQIATQMLQGGKFGPVSVGSSGVAGSNGGQSFVGTSDHPGYYDPVAGRSRMAIELGDVTARDAMGGDGVGVLHFLHEYAHSVLGIKEEAKANQMAIAVLPQLLQKFWHKSPAQARAALQQALSYIRTQEPPVYHLPANNPPPLI